MTINRYLDRIPDQHKNKPKFKAALTAFLSPFCQLQDLMEKAVESYDVDSAVGTQLDVCGQWVGCNRVVDKPLSGIYFEFDGTADVGFDSGIWKGKYDPDTGLVYLDDDTYRTLIKLQIAANQWDGTVDHAYDLWRNVFDRDEIVVVDHQNMTMDIGIVGSSLSNSQKALFTRKISPFKPIGVRISTYFIPTIQSAPFFAFDVDSDRMAGFDRGCWADKLI